MIVMENDDDGDNSGSKHSYNGSDDDDEGDAPFCNIRAQTVPSCSHS